MIRVTRLTKIFETSPVTRKGFWEILVPSKVDREPGSSTVCAVNDVSVEIREGEIVGILGQNGAGKTSLLQLIAGVAAPTSGTVEIEGRLEAVLSLETQFSQELTGRENAYHHFRMKGISEPDL